MHILSGIVLGTPNFEKAQDYQPPSRHHLAHGKRPLWEYVLVVTLTCIIFFRQTFGLSTVLDKDCAENQACAQSPRSIGKPSFFVMIPSAIWDVEARNAIRSTWASQGCNKVDREVKFMICSAPGTHEISRLANQPAEWETSNDMVFINCIEGSRWKGLKTITMFQWAYHHRPDADWIIKMDTDLYPFWPKLLELFTADPSESIIWGYHYARHGLKTGVGGMIYGLSHGLLKSMGNASGGYFINFFTTLPKKNHLVSDDWSMSVMVNLVEHTSNLLSPERVSGDWPYWGHSGPLKDHKHYHECYTKRKCSAKRISLVKPENWKTATC